MNTKYCLTYGLRPSRGMARFTIIKNERPLEIFGTIHLAHLVKSFHFKRSDNPTVIKQSTKWYHLFSHCRKQKPVTFYETAAADIYRLTNGEPKLTNLTKDQADKLPCRNNK